MKENGNGNVDRRDFLKSATLATAGLTVAAAGLENMAEASSSEWVNRSAINPGISNTKVVCCHDTAMISDENAAKIASTLTAQNAVLNTAKVESNLDQMVLRLTGKNASADAWAVIFRKAESKQWADVKVALKVNCIDPKNMPRIAIVGKVCKELIKLGVKATNMTIYDGGHNASGNNKYPPFIGNGIPTGVVVQNGQGSTTSVKIGSGNMSCTNVVISSDILVNFAVNKGHGQDKGGFTLTMKNHTGTMKFSCPSPTEMVNQNKSATILGGSIPRQQLCIVDSIWAEKSGPVAELTHLPCRIVMGVMGPAVDILTARKIREPIMSASHNNTAMTTLISGFGYTESELQWDEFTPSTTDIRIDGRRVPSFSDVTFNVAGNHQLEHVVHFSVPSDSKAFKAEVVNLSGKVVQKLSSAQGVSTIIWDGKDSSGKHVPPGMYVVKIEADQFIDAKPFSIASR